MLCFQANPWGEVSMGLHCLYQEIPNTEPTLTPLFYDQNGMGHPYGPNLYFQDHLKTSKWQLGHCLVRNIGTDEAYLVQINFWKAGERLPFQGKLKPVNAFQVAEGIDETGHHKIYLD